MGATQSHSAHGQRDRPVVLQVSRVGLWFDLVHFDAGDIQAEEQVRSAVEALAAVDQRARFRIITREACPLHLLTYNAADGWVVV